MAVQQGGGTGMKDNKVYVGWNGDHPIMQVDSTLLGKIFCDLFPPTAAQCKALSLDGGTVGSKGLISKGDIKADCSNIITRGGAYYMQNSDGVNIAVISASSGGTIQLRPLTGNAVVNAQAELHEYNQRVYSPNNPPPYPVTSVNGAMGAISIKDGFSTDGTGMNWNSAVSSLKFRIGTFTLSATPAASVTVTFPSAFANGCLIVIPVPDLSVGVGAASAEEQIGCTARTSTYATLTKGIGDNSARGGVYMAVGW